MASTKYLANHVANVYKTPNGGGAAGILTTLYWGDSLTVESGEESPTQVTLEDGRKGWIKGKLKTMTRPPLALAFIDVAQGDACLITTPGGRRILVDGGENEMCARYLAARYWSETSKKQNVRFDAIVITHGDADHFAGLSTLVLDAAKEARARKGITVQVDRVFHNGLVKLSAKSGSKARKETEMFGSAARDAEGRWWIDGLVDDPREFDVKELNPHFKRWTSALDALAERGSVEVGRLDSSTKAPFSFETDVQIDVLGPVTVRKGGKPCLPFLGGSAPSVSKTINGHSVVLRLSYGNVRLLLTGDMNRESETALLKDAGGELQAEVLKVPHHGSDDVSRDFLVAVNPVVSVISAGDDSERNDYMHPRASLLGALAHASRDPVPLIFVTDLNAFDKYVGLVLRAVKDKKKGYTVEGDPFLARQRTQYGITHVRTDGKTIFVARRGSNAGQVEAYCLGVDVNHAVKQTKVDKI